MIPCILHVYDTVIHLLYFTLLYAECILGPFLSNYGEEININNFTQIYFSKKNQTHRTGMIFVFFFPIPAGSKTNDKRLNRGPTVHGMRTQPRSMPSATPWAWTMHPWVCRERIYWMDEQHLQIMLHPTCFTRPKPMWTVWKVWKVILS